MKQFYLPFLFVCSYLTMCLPLSQAQNTVGLISFDPDSAFAGYNLIFPHNQSNVYLLNNCGEIVNQWDGDSGTRPGNAVYLLEDGRLVKTSRSADIASDPIWAGGGGATIEILDWDNNLEWSYTLNNDSARLHHDIEVIERNGKLTILAIAWEKKTLEEVIEAGRDTSVLERAELWPDYIFEIDPANDEIVWEWHAWDHLIQDRDTTLSNFGQLDQNPGKIDINYDFDGTGDPDWMHANSIDYDPLRRQIILSVPNFHEVWIIDHSTTTAEAARDRGGLSNKGGDLMFRWGNPQTYNRGDSSDQQLFYQHDVSLMEDFILPNDPLYRNLLLFNNRVGPNFSTVNVISPTFTSYDWQYQLDPGGYAPASFLKTITHPEDSSRLWSTILSSAQYLPNGNYLIGVGRFGYLFELTPNNEIVWEYIVPIRGGAPASQGDTLTINQNLNFRVRRYPTDYGAFSGRDLTPTGTIELNPVGFPCELATSTSALEEELPVLLFPNPAKDWVTLSFGDALPSARLSVFTINGERIGIETPWVQQANEIRVNVSRLPTGLYLLQLNTGNTSKTFRLIKQ